MAGKYYNLDPDSLKFRRVKPDRKKRLRSYSLFFLSSLLLSIIISLLYLQYFCSPKAERLQRRNSRILAKYVHLNNELKNANSFLERISVKDDSLFRVIAEVKPISRSIREGGFGGTEKYKKYENFSKSELVALVAKKLDVITNKANIQLKSYDEVYSIIKEKEKKNAAMPAISPIPEYDIGYISGIFGYRIHPIHKQRQYHWGVDLTADIGTVVRAPGDGVVERINLHSSGYGRTLLINHGYGFKTLYGHISRFNVKEGQKVKRGDIIAFVGNAGTSSGSHLHYEIITKGIKTNPFNYFTLEMDSAEYNSIISNNKDLN